MKRHVALNGKLVGLPKFEAAEFIDPDVAKYECGCLIPIKSRSMRKDKNCFVELTVTADRLCVEHSKPVVVVKR